MDRKGKNILILGGICIGLGVVGMTVGKVAGADQIIHQSIREKHQQIMTDFGDTDDDFFERDRNQDRNNYHERDCDGATTNMSTLDESTSIQEDRYETGMQSVQKIELDIKARNVLLKTGNVDTIIYEGTVSTDEITADSTEFKIEDHSNSYTTKKNKKTLEITIPNRLIHEIDIQVGAGNIELDGIDANMLDLEVGAGNVTLDQVTVHSQTDVVVGTGDLEANNSVFYAQIDMECATGNVEIDGELLGNSTIECAIGNLIMNLKNDRNNYHISTEGGIGTIEIDGEKVGSAFLSEYDDGNTNQFLLELEVAMGNTEINFNK